MCTSLQLATAVYIQFPCHLVVAPSVGLCFFLWPACVSLLYVQLVALTFSLTSFVTGSAFLSVKALKATCAKGGPKWDPRRGVCIRLEVICFHLRSFSLLVSFIVESKLDLHVLSIEIR